MKFYVNLETIYYTTEKQAHILTTMFNYSKPFHCYITQTWKEKIILNSEILGIRIWRKSA